MNTGYLARRLYLGIGLWLLLLSSASAQTKYIRLRNEIIATPPPPGLTGGRAAEKSPTVPVSGLFLVQFLDHPQPAFTEQLQTMGVELLRYVPDDSFVARFNNVSLGQIKALPFVHWVGAYRPDHKLHRSFQRQPNLAPAATSVSVSILLSPSVAPAEIAQARGLMERVYQESHPRFGPILRGTVNPAWLQTLAQSSAVLWIEPGPRMKLHDEIASKIVAGDSGRPGLTLATLFGFTGAGVTVAVADSGLYTGTTSFMHPDLAGRVRDFLFYGNLEDGADEHSHGTHVAGIVAGNGATGETDESGALFGLGVAPGASLLIQRIFDGAGNYEAPPSFEVLTHDAVRGGAEIGSNSWGDDVQGTYDLSAAEFDALVRDADDDMDGDQPYILEFSAGNAGPGPSTIDSPAVAKNVIATGASENDRSELIFYGDGTEFMADFSSRGPCEDGRIKPDLVAPGIWISSLRSPWGDDDNGLYISDYYLYQGGTSQAGPHVSGAAAVFVEYYRERYGPTPSPALVKAALINSAINLVDELGDTGPVPNMDEGWGRVNLAQLLGSSRHYQFVDQSQLLRTGQTYEQSIVVSGNNEPLTITLAYTDVPGFPPAIPALVNDLDLEVIGPDGTLYRGNQFDAGESVPSAPTPDNINNVEGVRLSVPLPGEYLVRVRARSVPLDARRETLAIDQDFALVMSGEFPAPGTAILSFDRPAYTAPSEIRIRLIDSDLAGLGSTTVTLKSTTEPAGFNVTLLPSGSPGSFTGTVPVVTGAANNDSKLQIAHGDSIQATYFDASRNVTVTASAVGDLVPPVISGVSVANQFGEMVISWTTDEPASSFVRFGTNASLLFSATNSSLDTVHEVELGNLIVGRTYYFVVISTDAAGNSRTNNNGGPPFNFVVPATPSLLLVDAYGEDPFGESEVIPLSSYTDALNQTGVSFEVWEKSSRGSPAANNLKPYRAVIWRINDSFWVGDTLEPQEQAAITTYLNGGGAFLMTSMEILSHLGSVPFRSNILHVVNFAEDVGVPEVLGGDDEPTTSRLDVTLDYSAYPFLEGLVDDPDLSDTFTVDAVSTPILFDSSSGHIAGVRYPRTGQDSTGRVVFLSFPLDAVPASGPNPNNRAALLRNVLNFLIPGLNTSATIALDSEAYSIPSLVKVEVADSKLEGLAQAAVNFFSDTQPGGQSIAIYPTITRGLFRGAVTLVPDTSTAAGGQLRVRNGDTLRSQYIDPSTTAAVQAHAVVDSQPPLIFSVTPSPDYDQATITWQTSEPADSLIQFGESSFFGRTAYSADLETDHEVTLTGLAPGRGYFFRVVSRDAAGNTTVDDNSGDLYGFSTLQPRLPPVTANFDQGAGDWTVYNGEETQAIWTLGVPHNGMETAAHSPPNAWGSNLGGDSIDTADTFLISPAISLVGGNSAKLHFWHSYDFSDVSELDILQGGELLLIVSGSSEATSLSEYFEVSAGWEEEEIVLTPYLGKVVFLVWHHQLLSFESAPRAGWLLDDVSVVVETLPYGTIRVTNNLAQAGFTITSQNTTNKGKGNSFIITNALPGQYVITFTNIPFYHTPASQTKTLEASNTVVFEGAYTFDDTNNNGISDAWETNYFGAISPSRTRFTDTDGDGMTDYAEFLAGTNPTLSSSRLQLIQPAKLRNGTLVVQWRSIPGRNYRLSGSTNGTIWTPLSDWTLGKSTYSYFAMRAPATPSYLFRLEVKP